MANFKFNRLPRSHSPHVSQKTLSHLAIALLTVNTPTVFPVNIFAIDADGNTALHYCSMYGNERVATRLLTDGANINSTNLSGYIPFSILTLYGDINQSSIHQNVYIHHEMFSPLSSALDELFSLSRFPPIPPSS